MCTITDNSGGNLDQQQQRDGDDDNEIAAETTISRFDDDGGKIVLSSPSSLSVSALALSEECPASIVRPSILDRWPEDPPSYDTDSAGGIHKQPLCSLLSYLRRLYGNWTYSYMNIVLKKGAQQNRRKGGSAAHVGHQYLTSDDLYSVPRNMRSDRLVHDFQQYEDASRVSRPDWSSRRRLLWTLWRIAAPTYVPAGLCELLVVICGTALPLLVRKLLSVLEEHPDENITRLGLPWGLAISFVSILNGLGNHRHRHLALRTGVGLRAAIVNLIYSHVLHLSPEGKRHLTSGEISNLVAVDAQKLFEVTQEGHLIWALPLQIVLVTFFLYRVLGPSILVGIAVLVGFLPIINVITSKMMRVRSMRIRCSDKRVEIVSNMLQGIKVTKLNHYEDSYYNRIKLLRDEELKHLAVEMAFWGSTLLIMVSSPVLATAACFTTYVLLEPGTNLLTAANTFGVLLLFSALRFPINFAGRLIGKAAQALSAIRRIALFLDRPLRKDDVRVETEKTTAATEEGNGSTIDDDDTPLRLIKASFRIGEVGPVQVDDNGDDELSGTKNDMDSSSVGTAIAVSFTVAEFNFSIKKGEVLAVCGPVGSGKSTFINGIFDEAEALGDTRVLKRGQFSYAPQNPFILNESLRDNILFGLPYDEEWYNQVLDACALRPDIEQLGGSDLVQIGERGVTLSGGQRQRCSLARATYTRAACIVLDDPFSALDSGTGKQVFERLISSPDALLKDSAVLLVTHASHLISHRAVDKILLMVNGKNQFYGTWDELNNFQSSDEATKRAVEHINSQVRENTKESDSDEANEYDEKKDEQKLIGKQKKKKIMEVETREHGLSSMKTWLLWFQRAGGVRFMGLQAMFLTIDRFAYIVVEWFLARWTSGVYTPVVIAGIEFPPQTEGLSAQAQYLKVYAGIILVSVIATACRSEYAVTGGSRAAKNVFYTMLSSVLRAPMSYFETIPMGRILNRFTYDTDVIDVNLTQVMSTFIISCSWYIAGCIIQIAILPWSVLVLFPVSLMYWGLMLLYRMSGPDLQRIDALSRSPLQSMVSECLEGSTSIRIFHQDANFVRRFGDFANINSSALLNFVSAQRWLGVRMEFMGSAVVLVSTTLVVCMNETLGLEAGLAGMLILWSSNFTITLNFMVDTFSETEAAITAIERVDAMADLPQEKPFETAPELQPAKTWPEHGCLEFEHVSLRYREGLPLALNDLSFKIPAGKTCGVVGRTGAGKSSITVALFRLVEAESGRILLDGIDLCKLGLADVRGRGMSIIPQDPFLAGATLRGCLDPFRAHSDEEIMDALQAVRLGSSSVDANTLLSTKLEEGGSNYSVGERQLLNLARALLSQPKVLVLDEATASIDGETDAFIQRMLRTRFPSTTLVTIAHRLNTIMDNDYVLVMDAGHCVEFDSPAKLLEIQGGVFAELVDSTGAESSKALRDMAIETATNRTITN